MIVVFPGHTHLLFFSRLKLKIKASMQADHFLYFDNGRIYGEDLVPVGCIWASGGLGCCPFWGGSSVVIDFLFIVTPIVRICNCSMSCCTLLY